MAQQPDFDKSLVTYTILSEGKEIEGTFIPNSIRISQEINKIAFARIEFFDGSNTDNEEFLIAHSDVFKPGKKIGIKAGYESDEELIFEGIVTKHQLKVGRDQPLLQIECKDEAVKMTSGRHNEIFKDKKDSDIIKDLFQKHGLQGKVEATKNENPNLIQHFTSDWDFMLMRADINDLIVITKNGSIEAVKPNIDQSPLFDVTYGTDLLGFEAEMDIKNQYNEVSVVGWDSNDLKIVESTTQGSIEVNQGQYKSKELSNVLNSGKTILQTGGNLPVAALEAWGKSLLTKSRLAKIKGKVTIRGNNKIKPNSIINLNGVSNTFNGEAYISGVYHIIEEGSWVCELQIGLKEKWYTEETPNIEGSNAAGLNAAVQGLQIGLVKKLNEDPDGNYRVQVVLPTLQKDNMPVWARLSNFYSSKDAGIFFIPEVGDEVILGFLNNDPQFPIIIGSLYSKTNKPAYTNEAENGIKSLLTKSRLEIQFNDTDKILTLSTPGGHQVVLDDKEKSLTIIDEANKNKVVLSDEGILMESDKDIVLKAKGDIKLESVGSTEIKASKDMKAEGINVEMKGKTKFAAEGAQAELKGSGMTTIKGGVVQIN